MTSLIPLLECLFIPFFISHGIVNVWFVIVFPWSLILLSLHVREHVDIWYFPYFISSLNFINNLLMGRFHRNKEFISMNVSVEDSVEGNSVD